MNAAPGASTSRRGRSEVPAPHDHGRGLGKTHAAADGDQAQAVIEVGGKALLDHVLEKAADCGVRKVV